jgi:hypothetical protein
MEPTAEEDCGSPDSIADKVIVGDRAALQRFVFCERFCVLVPCPEFIASSFNFYDLKQSFFFCSRPEANLSCEPVALLAL